MTEPIKCFLLDHGFTTQTNTSCCLLRMDSEKTKPTYLEFINSDVMLRIKRKMDNGIWSEYCNTCKKVENLGQLSQRMGINLAKEYLTKQDFNKKATLKDLTIYIGNKCNLQCRSCHPGASSSWENEIEQNKILYEKILPYSLNYSQEQNLRSYPIEKEDLSNLESVTFLGGEVVYNKQFIDYLKIIYENTKGDCNITIITNATLKIDFEKHKFIKNFRTLNIIVSIDGTEQSSEFIRTGTNWNKIIDTIEYYKKFDFLYLSNHTTHSILNIFEIEKINNWLKKHNILNVDQITYVEHPDILTYKVLTDQEKIFYREKTKNNPEFKFIYDKMNVENYDSILREKFLEYMDVTNRIHGMNWKDYLPDLYNLMNHFT